MTNATLRPTDRLPAGKTVTKTGVVTMVSLLSSLARGLWICSGQIFLVVGITVIVGVSSRAVYAFCVKRIQSLINLPRVGQSVQILVDEV